MNIRERPDQPVRVKITVMVKGAVVFSRAYDEDSAKEGGKLHDFFSSVKVCIKFLNLSLYYLLIAVFFKKRINYFSLFKKHVFIFKMWFFFKRCFVSVFFLFPKNTIVNKNL